MPHQNAVNRQCIALHSHLYPLTFNQRVAGSIPARLTTIPHHNAVERA